MLFGLKNTGAMYQRLMNKMFANQIGRNVQVYVDDMLVYKVMLFGLKILVADFIAEFTNGEDKGADEYLQWSIHTDGSSNRQASGAGIVFLSPEGDKIKCMVHLDFPTTNNEAEYEVLVAGL